MSTQRRVQQQPAYILHHRPFRDSSQILDLVTRDHGKVALVARGSRGAKSRLAGVLRPFLPLSVSWVARSDLGTLTGAESAGLPVGLRGDEMLAAYYANELILNFLHRHDPQPEIFALYGETVKALGASADIAACLRSFEIELLSLLGYALNFEYESGTRQPLRAGQYYEYRQEQGAVPVTRSSGPMVFDGEVLMAIRAQQFDEPQVLASASRLLREVVSHHLGGRELKSRKVLLEVHRGRLSASEKQQADSD
ncbi:MAG: DNA repair protein RecO [Gammaproteobacteria bacterium]|nr:DNA repair protein RecO [Gammaproteobacteria bacterium]